MNSKLTTAVRMFLGFSIAPLGLLLLALYGLSNLATLRDQATTIVNQDWPKIEPIMQIATGVRDNARNTRDLLLAPLGSGLGPSPVQLLAAAVGNCLSDSLLFALRKFKQAPEPIECTVTAEVGRNEEKRLRVLKMTAVLKLGVSAASLQHLDRVLDQFEAFCTVTQSVGQGIAIELQVVDAAGVRLK